MEFKTNCMKHEGHDKFIPMSKFSEKDLPSSFVTHAKRSELFDLIRQQADLTVRIKVDYVSANRGTDDPFFSFKDTNVRRFGSGWVKRVDEGQPMEACPCSECASAPQRPRRRLFTVHVQTAKHVVYDIDEAKSTVVDLFYDDDTKPTEERNDESNAPARTSWRRPRQLRCVASVDSDLDLDLTVLKCITHDEEVYHRLQAAVGLLARLTERLVEHFSFENYVGICNRYKVRRLAVSDLPRQTFVAVVSHPHGLPKQVTLGALLEQVLSKNTVDCSQTCFLITTLKIASMANKKEQLTELCNFFKQISFNSDSCDSGSKCVLLEILLDNRPDECRGMSEEEYGRQLNGCSYCNCCTDERKDTLLQVGSVIKTVIEKNCQINDAGRIIQGLKSLVMSCGSQMSNTSDQSENSRPPSGLDCPGTGFDVTIGSSCEPEQSSRLLCSKKSSDSSTMDRSVSDLTRSKYRIWSFLSSLSSYFYQEAEKACSEPLYMLRYDALTCPGSSGAPVLILHQKPSTFLEHKYYDLVRTQRANLHEIFYTHCTWKRGFASSTGQEKLSPSVKASHCNPPCCCPCNDTAIQTQRKRKEEKELARKSSTDCRGLPPQLAPSQEEPRNSLLFDFITLCKDIMRRVSSKLWSWQSATSDNLGVSEADMDNITALVVFPKGEIVCCEIYFNTRLVKEEKERLLSLADEDYGSPDNFKMQLYPAHDAQAPITLDDDEEILVYIDEFAGDAKLKFVSKQANLPDIGPSLGVKLKF